jgi:hypothetical protein
MMMNTSRYYVDKTSDTSADTLLTIGFASLLSRVLRDGRILVRDVGPSYSLELPRSLTDDDLRELEPFSLILPLVSDKQKEKQAAQGQRLDGFDYQKQQEISKNYYAKLKDLPPECRTPQARLQKSQYPMLANIDEPDWRLSHYRTINQMKIASSFNELTLRWSALETLQREHIYLLLTLFDHPLNDMDTAVSACQKIAKEHGLKGKILVTALQIVNATTGKGANRPKSSILTEGNQEGLWLLELLKFVGFLDAAAPYVIQGGKDRKTYVLQPDLIELNALHEIMRRFRAVCWSSSAVKMDIMASLRFAQAFITHREQSLKGEEDDFFDDAPLTSIAHGFEVTSYKDMGSAYATMNVSTINFPQWLGPVTTLTEVEAAHQLLKEHLQIIQQIRNGKGEEGAEEYTLLRHYRDFLSGRDLHPFWQFTTAYSGYLISQREREKNPQKHLRQFTTTGLESLIAMNTTTYTQGTKKLGTITSNEGFKRIAYAIRQSTVKAQYRRAQLRDRTYDVRYGLGQELMREARYSSKFIAALSAFLQEYNAETAREEEKLANRLGRQLTLQDRRNNRLRRSVAYTDIDAIVALIDDFGSEQVCSLLVAYGYASDPRKESQDGITENAPMQSTPDDADTDEEQ